jgi:hypothetical protein
VVQRELGGELIELVDPQPKQLAGGHPPDCSCGRPRSSKRSDPVLGDQPLAGVDYRPLTEVEPIDKALASREPVELRQQARERDDGREP